MFLQAKERQSPCESVPGCRTRKEQAEELTGQLTEEQKEEFAALEELGSTAEQVCCYVRRSQKHVLVLTLLTVRCCAMPVPHDTVASLCPSAFVVAASPLAGCPGS